MGKRFRLLAIISRFRISSGPPSARGNLQPFFKKVLCQPAIKVFIALFFEKVFPFQGLTPGIELFLVGQSPRSIMAGGFNNTIVVLFKANRQIRCLPDVESVELGGVQYIYEKHDNIMALNIKSLKDISSLRLCAPAVPRVLGGTCNLSSKWH